MRASERERGGLPGRAIGAKVPTDHYEALRWLAYTRHTTISAIVAAYVKMGLALERDLIGWDAPSSDPGQQTAHEASPDHASPA